MKSKNFNEELKRLEAEGNLGNNRAAGLDDTQRVKVLSPGRLVFKRFVRNKLAIVGTAILAFMFVFSFFGPIFYPYNQTQVFYVVKTLENADYASAKYRQEYNLYQLNGDITVPYSVLNMSNFYINEIERTESNMFAVEDSDSGAAYAFVREEDNIYTIKEAKLDRIAVKSAVINICEYDMVSNTITYGDVDSLGAAFEEAVTNAVRVGQSSFDFDGKSYEIARAAGKKYNVTLSGNDTIVYTAQKPGEGFEAAIDAAGGKFNFEYEGSTYIITYISAAGDYFVDRLEVNETVYVMSPYVINLRDDTASSSKQLLTAALTAAYKDRTFNYGGVDYVIRDEDNVLNIYNADSGDFYGTFTTFSVNRSSGSGAILMEFKEDVRNAIDKMNEAGIITTKITTLVEKQLEDGSIATDEKGRPIYAETEVTIERKGEDYSIRCDRLRYLIDEYARPFSPDSPSLHIFGTDANGFDVLARMMHGGRISLMVGFVVVIIETILGIIMGGISGYFGGWVDTLIMRLVDIFYCIPSMPIMIILGGFFDNMQLDQTWRLIWLMAVLGFLGWAGVARIVRGQILSLREQEFMLATEVGGLRVSRRIFRHLVPNVMPQLIVTATAGLGSVILTESTLSFLGLGVKPPYATWGTMINSVSDYYSMINYTYIWVPVGLLICLTVIAFNFVGDGLRDAFDPKMKR